VRCSTYEDVVRMIELVVKHEIGHYFGISDARLHELGYA
jgi:predicted Zn-dependent protease with MMP-like domain